MHASVEFEHEFLLLEASTSSTVSTSKNIAASCGSGLQAADSHGKSDR